MAKQDEAFWECECQKSMKLGEMDGLRLAANILMDKARCAFDDSKDDEARRLRGIRNNILDIANLKDAEYDKEYHPERQKP